MSDVAQKLKKLNYNMNDFISPRNKVENWAQTYITNVDCSTHEKAQATETIDLIKKACNYSNVESMAEVIAILLDANNYRTMDIMGIVLHLVGDKAFSQIKL